MTVVGVDLGTTFVAAAIARPTGVEMLTLGERAVVMPAVVAVDPDGTLVSGDAAERLGTSQAVAREVRRRLGDTAPVRLGHTGAGPASSTFFSVTALLAAPLREVVRRVAEAEGAPPQHVALTHPAHWGRYRRDLLVEVAAAAGIEAVQLVPEPVAAVHHAFPARTADGGRAAEGAVVAVYDLGGGTLDATVVRRTADGPEILGRPESIERLGGVDFDEAILSYVDEYADGVLAGLDLDDPATAAAVARLRRECVSAKETLSTDTETTVPVLLPGHALEVRLTRASFEDMIRSAVEATVAALSRTVESAGLTPQDVSAVLLLGGSSRIPLVRELVARELGRPVVDTVDPKHAVALGAAAIAAASPAPVRRPDPAPAPAVVPPPARPAAVSAIPPPARPSAPPPVGPPARPPATPPTVRRAGAGRPPERPAPPYPTPRSPVDQGTPAAAAHPPGPDLGDETTTVLHLPRPSPGPPAAPMVSPRAGAGHAGMWVGPVVLGVVTVAVLVFVLVFVLLP